MKYFLAAFLLVVSLNGFSQTIEVVEQSISVCYMNDNKRTDIVAVTKADAELDHVEVIGYFDCSAPISGPCDDASIGKYIPNSISVNGKLIKLGGQLNGENVSRFNVGRFFEAKDHLHKFLIFEMADVDCPNVPDNYCYIIICLDKKNKIIQHVLYNKEYNPIMEEELATVIGGLKKSVLPKENKNQESEEELL